VSVQGWRVTVRKKIVNFLKPTQTTLFFCRRVHHPSWTHYWQIVRGWTLVIDGPFKCALVCGCKTTLRCPQRPPLVPQTKQTIKQKSPLLSHERRICPRRTFLGGGSVEEGVGVGLAGFTAHLLLPFPSTSPASRLLQRNLAGYILRRQRETKVIPF